MKLSQEQYVTSLEMSVEDVCEGQLSAASLKESGWQVVFDEDNEFSMPGAPVFKINRLDESAQIDEIMVSCGVVGINFRNKEKHQQAIESSKLKMFFVEDVGEEIEQDYQCVVSFVCEFGGKTNTSLNMAILLKLLCDIEGESFTKPLQFMFMFLGKYSGFSNKEMLSYLGALGILEEQSYESISQLVLTSGSRMYLIDELYRLAKEGSEHNNKIIPELVNLCAMVPENHARYKEVNQVMLECTFHFDDTEGKREKISRLENRLRCALRAENQRLIDLTYHELCGEEGVGPVMTEIDGDEDTLIMLAGHIRAKNELIKKMSHPKTPEPMRFDFGRSQEIKLRETDSAKKEDGEHNNQLSIG